MQFSVITFVKLVKRARVKKDGILKYYLGSCTIQLMEIM